MTTATTSYTHTQQAPWKFILGLMALAGLAFAAVMQQPPGLVAGSVFALVMSFCALTFGDLTVRDDGDALLVRFGPLPTFQKRIPFAAMLKVEPDRSTVLDGWGIHWGPCKGWIYNLWGFKCVRISLQDRTIRVGTDDPEGLVNFLQSRLRRAS